MSGVESDRMMGVAPVCIIGAGPCGLAAAVAMREAGIPAVVFDAGCVCSSIASYPTYISFFSTAEKIAVGGLPFPVATEKPTRRDALAYYRAVVTHFGLDVRQYEPVSHVTRVTGAAAVTGEAAVTGAARGTRGRGSSGTGAATEAHRFVVHSRPRGGVPRETRASAVIVATGYFGTPNRLGVPGEELPHVTHFFKEGHEAFQRTALVVGGGNSAVETALDLYRAGARVTMAHFGPTFDKNIKPWVLPDFEGRVKEGSITVLWNARVVAIEPDVAQLRVSSAGIERTALEGTAVESATVAVAAQHVYLMTGYTPRPELLAGLDVGVDAATGVPAHDPATMETPTPGVFIAGVLASGYDANKIFIENGRDHGRLIAGALRRT